MKRFLLLILFIIQTVSVFCQGTPPWQNALIMVQSNDGVNFNSPAIFQDSSGVPCIIRWKSDTLVCVFQWFRQPNPSPSWDRVAVKFSYDNGVSWTAPTPIVVNSLPVTYQRPFDPTIVVTPDKKIRIFYSSSDGTPPVGQNATINTYSALSADGINYIFEPGARFDHPTNRVIDPGVIIFNGTWHYTAPIGAPQDGAYHATGTDGLVFTQTANINSDNIHNWTGNLLVDGTTLRFYGGGSLIWYNSSTDGNSWNGYVNTNIGGGDPGIVKLSNGKYIMVYVGPNIITATGNTRADATLKIFPNPFASLIHLQGKDGKQYPYSLLTASGALLRQGKFTGTTQLNLEHLPAATYLLVTEDNKKIYCSKLVKK